jgi:hypothetical protein
VLALPVLLIITAVFVVVVLSVLVLMQPKRLKVWVTLWPPAFHVDADSGSEPEVPPDSNS